jgi:hypothetical protein
MSVYTFVFLGTAPIGNSFIGFLADSFGTTQAISIAAFFCIITSMVFFMKIFKGRWYSRPS